MGEAAVKFTAGDWRLEGVSDAVRVVVGTGRAKIILARLCPPQLPELETWANARLMAAAPALLKALEGFYDGECHCDTAQPPPCVMCLAKAAIDKATQLPDRTT